MKMTKMRTACICAGCGETRPGAVLIQAVDTSPVINTMVLCPDCLIRLNEMLTAFAIPQEAG